jgi:hypothetical protein
MTDEERLAEVECALDGQPGLIAQARAAFQEAFDCEWFYFVSGQYDSHAYRWEKSAVEALSRRGLDRTAIGEIYQEEEAKFCAQTQQTVDPEVWRVYTSGTVEERETFPTYHDPAALEEWIEDRKHQKNRKDYAQKFYGVNP